MNLRSESFCSEIDYKTRESWEWGVCEWKLWREQGDWIVLRVANEREPQKGAALRKAVWREFYDVYREFISEVDKGAGREGF